VSAKGGFSVHVRYPFPYGTADDETWLAAVTARHNGELDDSVMESAPQQRVARFLTSSAARDFQDDLTSSGRWEAAL
jgi:hypothetical protein